MVGTVTSGSREQAAAHSTSGSSGTRIHALEEHLAEVARHAANHASVFGGQEWALLAGLWHDLGKYRPGFQRYLRAATGAEAESAHIEGGTGRVSHSTAGALLACQRFGTAGRVLAYLIASHHAGLYDWNSDTLVTADRKIDDYGRAGHVSVLGA